MLEKLKDELKSLSGSPEKKAIMQNFFKTGKGQYAQGDVFLGVSMPNQRKVGKKYIDLQLKEIKKLLQSKIHEHRMTALLILVYKYKSAVKDKEEKEARDIVDFYLKNTKCINNWDLVDCSSYQILGHSLINQDKKILYKLAKSNNLWERRISIVSTYELIRNEQLQDTFKIAKILLSDKHDLIHKAVGWMLREAGKRNEKRLVDFINQNIRSMPRTTLRYAIEKFPEAERKQFLKK